MTKLLKIKNTFTTHPVWLAGFRPFFILAMLSGVILPVLWAASYSGNLFFKFTEISNLQWHSHEMFYGFGWAVLGGFLLTATKNWVHVRGIHGGTLALVTFLWIIERIVIFNYDAIPSLLRVILLNLFIVFIIGYILWTLVYFRKQDTFKDNYFFIIALPLFILAKNLLLNSANYELGWTLTMGLFRLAFVIMFERTLTQFMKNAMQVDLFRNDAFDSALKWTVLLSAFQSLMPQYISAVILLVCTIMLSFRFFMWKPQLGIKNFGISVSYIGLLGLVLHYAAETIRLFNLSSFVGSITIHIFTFVCMGVTAIGMFIRIAQGHTGRKLLFTITDRLAIYSILFGAFFRIIMTQLVPFYYSKWIIVAGSLWSLAYLLIAIRLIPFLLKPRLDGKVH